MEESGVSQASHKENTRCSRSVEMCPNDGNKHSFKECFSFLLESIADFGIELKMNTDVLSIFTNVSALNFTDLKPLHVYNCLQQYMVKLQTVSANLKLIVEAESQSTPTNSQLQEPSNNVLTATSEEDIVVDTVCLPAASHKNPGILKARVSDSTVQIKAGKAEIERRISAFIERKQLEINENNVREFCNVINCNQENSCARTDAIFTPYPGFKSHVKVTRVVNTYGPQTRAGHSVQEDQQQIYSRDCGNPAIEERLHNVEAHLKLTKAGPVPQSVYQRLKKLEDRILELEGLSPEYFHSTSYLHKRAKASVSQNYSLSELDGKISAVKTALLKRSSEFQSRDAREFPL